ncbi:MAG: B12-binding domain-containing radical SAM protein [Elusimicrobia bacterium]|nr:MAG: B12-binding domain-containing radical SAM protein [Elusimicrobiota bacterium]
MGNVDSGKIERVLLVYPAFSEFNYWNARDLYGILGKKHSIVPLGLITMASHLPKEWELSFVDLNCRPLSDAEIEACDLVMTGGMISQQPETLSVIKRVKALGKTVVVGGPDATSQPEVYACADFLVLDEAENTIHPFLEAIQRGETSGIFQCPEPKPDVTKIPIPRFDLVPLEDYLYPAVQYSRGCPYNCEFCDIIELYGRVPRVKTPDQLMAELTVLYEQGHRGGVELVDDNFIGNKREVKPMLRRLIQWQEEHDWPFYFGTEATITLAQDAELLSLMKKAQFKRIFIGIETPDPDLLRTTQKKQNTLRPIVEDVRRIVDHGMLVSAGLILGFDGEKTGAANAIVDLVEETDILPAMFGLLCAAPGTQLQRRLLKEGRLFQTDGGRTTLEGEVDQMTGGLDYIPQRPRVEILREYRDALEALYFPRNYFGRLRRLLTYYDPGLRYRSTLSALPGQVKGLVRLLFWIGPRWDLWGEFLHAAVTGSRYGMSSLNLAVMYAAAFLHFERQTKYVVEHCNDQIGEVEREGEEAYNRKRTIHAQAAVHAGS